MPGMFDNPSAFAPFFDDIVKIVANRADGKVIRGSFRACVSPIQLDDPFVQSDAASNRQIYSLLIPTTGENAWMESAIGSKPQIGDRVELIGGKNAAVTKVDPIVGDFFNLEVREC